VVTLPRITLSRSLIAASIAATAILVSAATAASSGSSRPERKVQILKVNKDAGHDFFIDVDRSTTPDKPAPDSVGDQTVFNAKFLVGNDQVGREGGACTLVGEHTLDLLLEHRRILQPALMARFSNWSSGRLLQMKNERREASSRSLTL